MSKVAREGYIERSAATAALILNDIVASHGESCASVARPQSDSHSGRSGGQGGDEKGNEVCSKHDGV